MMLNRYRTLRIRCSLHLRHRSFWRVVARGCAQLLAVVTQLVWLLFRRVLLYVLSKLCRLELGGPVLLCRSLFGMAMMRHHAFC